MTAEFRESPPRVPTEAPKQHEAPSVVFFSPVSPAGASPEQTEPGPAKSDVSARGSFKSRPPDGRGEKPAQMTSRQVAQSPRHLVFPGRHNSMQPSVRVCVCVFLRPDCSPSSRPLLFRESVGNRAAVCGPPSVRREELFSRCLPRWRRGTGGRQRETRRASGTFSA